MVALSITDSGDHEGRPHLTPQATVKVAPTFQAPGDHEGRPYISGSNYLHPLQ
jgi:hypothetical protein